jgi:hypothetical protein
LTFNPDSARSSVHGETEPLSPIIAPDELARFVEHFLKQGASDPVWDRHLEQLHGLLALFSVDWQQLYAQHAARREGWPAYRQRARALYDAAHPLADRPGSEELLSRLRDFLRLGAFNPAAGAARQVVPREALLDTRFQLGEDLSFQIRPGGAMTLELPRIGPSPTDPDEIDLLLRMSGGAPPRQIAGAATEALRSRIEALHLAGVLIREPPEPPLDLPQIPAPPIEPPPAPAITPLPPPDSGPLRGCSFALAEALHLRIALRGAGLVWVPRLDGFRSASSGLIRLLAGLALERTIEGAARRAGIPHDAQIESIAAQLLGLGVLVRSGPTAEERAP